MDLSGPRSFVMGIAEPGGGMRLPFGRKMITELQGRLIAEDRVMCGDGDWNVIPYHRDTGLESEGMYRYGGPLKKASACGRIRFHSG